MTSSGDWWDHTPTTRAQAGPLRRPRGAGAEEAEAVVAEVHRRTGGRPVG